jgi:hypothetical protein
MARGRRDGVSDRAGTGRLPTTNDAVRDNDPYTIADVGQYELPPWAVATGREDLDRVVWAALKGRRNGGASAPPCGRITSCGNYAYGSFAAVLVRPSRR